MRIAVDVGFGYTKAVSENDQRISFPSVVGVRHYTGKDEFLGGNKEDYQVALWPVASFRERDLKAYYVGDAAISAGNAVRNWEQNVIDNTNMVTLIMTAVAIIGDESPVDLAVGLPINTYRDQKETVQKILDGMKTSVAVDGYVGAKHVKVNSVLVFAQGAGAYYAACLDNKGNVKDADLVHQSVGVIDIGYRTTDFLVMSKGKKGLVPREDLMGGFDIGITQAYQEVQARAEEMTGGSIDLLWVEQALTWEKGILSHRGRNYNLKVVEENAYRNLTERITAKIKQRWGQELDRLGTVIIAGGGGEALFSNLAKAFAMVKKIENAPFANADGFLSIQALKRQQGQGE